MDKTIFINICSIIQFVAFKVKCPETPRGNNKVSVQLEIFFAGIPQGSLETSPGTIKKIQKRF